MRSRRQAAAVLLFLLLANRATADEPLEQAMRATCRVYSGNASGTSFLVAASDPKTASQRATLLVSAAHVFRDLPGAEATLVLRSRAESGAWERREVAVPIRSGEAELWVRHETEDVAALRVEIPKDVDAAPLNYESLAGEEQVEERLAHVGQEVFIPCFPAKLEANQAGWPVLRRGSIATYPLAPATEVKTMLVDMRVFGGESGAPVVATIDGKAGQEPLVVALISGMHRQSDTVVTPFEERTIHTPLGLAIAVQAPLIRATIDKLLAEVK